MSKLSQREPRYSERVTIRTNQSRTGRKDDPNMQNRLASQILMVKIHLTKKYISFWMSFVGFKTSLDPLEGKEHLLPDGKSITFKNHVTYVRDIWLVPEGRNTRRMCLCRAFRERERETRTERMKGRRQRWVTLMIHAVLLIYTKHINLLSAQECELIWSVVASCNYHRLANPFISDTFPTLQVKCITASN